MRLWAEPCPAIAGYGLPGAALPLPLIPVGSAQWANLISVVTQERIPGLLAQAITDGAMAATERQREDALIAHRASMATALLLERTLLRTADQFDEAGIEFRVLKGAGVAHLDYPDPAVRSFGDVDLLLPSAQFDAAVHLLVGAGHRRKYPEPRPGFDRRFGKGSCLVSPDGYEIDVHRTLALGPFGLMIRLDDLWASSSEFVLAGRRLHALGPEERFLHACFHAALGNTTPRLSALRDVAQIALTGALDVERVLGSTARWRAEPVVARAMSLAADILGVETSHPLFTWASAYQPDPRERRTLGVYTDLSQSYAAKSFAAIRALSGTRERAAFVLSLAFPRRGYADDRNESARHRWSRGLRQVLRSLRHR